jgi:hypothetical protein
MKLKILAFVAVMAMTVSGPANALILGFIMGSDYVKMDKQSQHIWVYGAMDGIMAESTDEKGTWLGRCVAKYDFEQLKAIFEKELNNNPESWHAPAAFVLQGRLSEFCGEK